MAKVSLADGWTRQNVRMLGNRKRLGQAVGRLSQIAALKLPGSDAAAVLQVVNELGDIRLYSGLPDPLEDIELRVGREGYGEARLGYSATGLPDHYRHATTLPRDDGGWDLLFTDSRAAQLNLARFRRTENNVLLFESPIAIADASGIPALVATNDLSPDAASHDLLLAKPDGRIVKRAGIRADDGSLTFDNDDLPLVAGTSAVDLVGPISLSVVDWFSSSGRDLLVGDGQGYVLLFEDITHGHGQPQYARGRRLTDAKGYLQVKGAASAALLDTGKNRRTLIVRDGEGELYSWPVQNKQSYVMSDISNALIAAGNAVEPAYTAGRWFAFKDGSTQVVMAGADPSKPMPGTPEHRTYDPPAPALNINVPEAGWYELHLTLRQIESVESPPWLRVRLSSEPHDMVVRGQVWHQGSSQEIFVTTAEFEAGDASIKLKQLQGDIKNKGGLPVAIERMQLVPVKPPKQAKPKKKRVPVAAVLDAPMWWAVVKCDTPDEVEELVEWHRQAGFDQLYYKLGGGCWEYPSNVPGARSTLPDDPDMTDEIRAARQRRIDTQEKINRVELAARACQARNMKCWGWMRVQNHGERLHGKGPIDQFYVEHPEYLEENLDGTPMAGKLSLAYHEVRDFHIKLCEEAIGLGCDGIMMDTLRHLPKVAHAKPVRESFEEKYGLDITKLPAFDQRVLEHQNEIFTSFLREVKQAIRAKKPDAPLHVRVCKMYPLLGCDPEGWVKEGLVDQVVLEHRQTVQTRPDVESLVKVCRRTDCTGIAAFARERWGRDKMQLDPYVIDREVADWLKVGADGISFYETAHVIDRPEFARAIRRINDPNTPFSRAW